MIWTEQHDVLLCREALLVEPFVHKQGSRERGNAWDVISTELNGITEILFNVTKRGVRDRYNLLIDNFKKQDRENDKASGIDVVETELDLLLRELVEKSLEASCGYCDKKKSLEAEKQCAEEIRFQAMESLGETRKRNEKSPEEETPRKSRRTSNDTVNYLRERSQREYELREQEMRVKSDETAIFRELILQKNNENSNQITAQLQQQQQVLIQQQASLQNQLALQNNKIEGMFSSLLELMKNKQ